MDRIIVKENLDFLEEESGLNETLFHNANGYIGVRGCLEEGVPKGWNTMRGMYINGFYDIIPMKQAEQLCNFVEEKQTMLNVADTQTIYLWINGEKFQMDQGTILKNKRTLDMNAGITLREVLWRSKKGKEVEIFVRRMTSFEQLSLFTIEYRVTPKNFEGVVTFESYHISDVSNYCNPNDPRLAAESGKLLVPQDVTVDHGCSMAVSKTVKSDLTMCSAVTHQIISDESGEMVCDKNGNTVKYTVRMPVKQDKSVTLVKYTVFKDSIRTSTPQQDAQLELLDALQKGLTFFYKKQSEYLTVFWNQSEMEILGDKRMNMAVSFNMYQLLQSAAKDSHCNIAAKGLSGEGYEGHYFWDTEMFMLPFFSLTNPGLAKMLLSYRYDILDAARNNARLLGHAKGALYPWRTITGAECSGYYPSGTAQYHIDGDIAYAIVNYFLITGDFTFMVEKGAEILFETARLWLDVGNYSNDRFVINDVTGPDEYTCMVNNNYYTNCCAKYNMSWAVKIYQKMEEADLIQKISDKIHLKKEEISEMEMAAEHMYLPFDEALKINPQDDSFLQKPVWNLEETPQDKFPLLLHYHPLYLYRYQVCKQADTVLSYFLFEDEQPYEVMKNSYNYYEKITTHDSSLSTCVFSIVASRLGMKDKAYYYFGNSAELDLENTHNNTKDGIHTANMGGCYMAIVYGFAGLRITEMKISLTPFLPEAWNGYNFKFRYKDNLLKIYITHDCVVVEMQDGCEMELYVYEQKIRLKKGDSVEVQYT